jgi:predicted dehydrogenase
MIPVLLLGRSRFAQKRVLPALAEMGATFRIASISAPEAEFHDYALAIAATPSPALVYVSLTNDAHAHWVERALEAGHHVVVDKPAFLDLATAEHLVALARTRGLVLAEAITYAFHPVIAALRAVGGTLATVTFTPPVPANDFRHQRTFGGGAIADLGPYFASIGRLLWGTTPHALAAQINSRGEVETSFSVLAHYGEGRTLVGHFGFTAPYRNWIHLAAPGVSAEATGIFSTPPEHATAIAGTAPCEVPPAFAMRLFLDEVFAAIERGDAQSFSDTLLADARVVEELRNRTR